MRRYLVLARRQYVESLTYQGTLDVDASADPAVAVRERYGTDWLELVLAPEPSVYWVVRTGAHAETPA
jgi:hypothetical protein